MKIVVFSDSHGFVGNMVHALEQSRFDRIIHLGDYTRDAFEIMRRYPEIPMDCVAGNGDYSDRKSGTDKILSVLDKKILITHGHAHYVSSGHDRLLRFAAEKDCDAILFGHTHIPYAKIEEGKLLLNPGSISCPRGGGKTIYSVLTVEEGSALTWNFVTC